MRKLTILLAGGIGYVLGARAGRERYEQIRRIGHPRQGEPDRAVGRVVRGGRRPRGRVRS